MQTESLQNGKQATWAHVVPFVAWLLLMYIPGEPAAWKYALRTGAGLLVFLWFRPWRWYTGLRVRHLLPAMLVGAGVFVLWVFPETEFAGRWPAFQKFYLTVAIQPPYELPKPLESLPYAPEVCGWPLALVRLAGSALVISCIEEFFWRGFLYRWLMKSDFLDIGLDTLRWGTLLLMAALFASVHARWLVGLFTGIIYGLFVIRTRDVWAGSIAHGVTNLLLGIYVLTTSSYEFW